MRKSSALIFLIALLMFAATGCDASVACGEYVMVNADGPVTPTIVIKSNGTFRFDYFLVSGKYVSGGYSVNGDTLTLSGGGKTFVFTVDGDVLEFNSYKSSEINSLTEIPNSAQFVLDND